MSWARLLQSREVVYFVGHDQTDLVDPFSIIFRDQVGSVPTTSADRRGIVVPLSGDLSIYSSVYSPQVRDGRRCGHGDLSDVFLYFILLYCHEFIRPYICLIGPIVHF